MDDLALVKIVENEISTQCEIVKKKKIGRHEKPMENLDR